MKKYITRVLLTLLLQMTLPMMAAAAVSMTLDSLHDMSNRMEHSEFMEEALRHDSLLKASSSAEWMRLLQVRNADTLMLRCMPTLYDIVVFNRINETYGEVRNAMAQDWVRFHANDTNLLARAYTYYIGDILHNNRKRYESLPDGWERGILLQHYSAAGDNEMLPLMEEYVSKYPESPFAEAIRNRIDRILQMKVSWLASQYFTTADSIRVDYNVTNAHKVVLYLRRAGLCTRPIDSCVVDFPSEKRLFERTNLHCTFAPQKAGTYLVYAVLPEDTLRSQRIYSFLQLQVSDLSLFTYSEPGVAKQRATCHAIATHALTGEPVRGAMVRGTKYGSTITSKFCRLTNREGHAAIRHKASFSATTTYAKKNRQRSMNVWSSCQFPSGMSSLQVYPNATIFRPGDTLRLAVVGSYVDMDERELMAHDTLSVQIRSPKRQPLLDTMLVTDAYGEAHLVFPIAMGSMLGNYHVAINNCTRTIRTRNTRTSCWFSVEDYRLPTFSLTLPHNDGQQLHAGDTAFVVTGSARLFSGLPMVGQSVTVRINYQGWETISQTSTTRMDGTFDCPLPAHLLRVLKSGDYCYLRAQLTAADGETHEASRYIWVEDDQPKTEIQPQSTPPSDPWEEKQLLWLPEDSLRYASDGKQVEVLIGIRQANPVYVVAASRKQIRSAEWHSLAVGLNRLTLDLPTDTNEYLDIHVMSTVHGVVYSEHVRAVAPLRQELHLTPITFRDYLCPGVEETWRWRLSNQQGESVQGRLLLTMLDEAVLSLSSLHYPTLLECWQQNFTQVSVPYPNTDFRTYQSVLPKRNPYPLLDLPLYESYISLDDMFNADDETLQEVVVTGYGLSGTQSSVKIRGVGSVHKGV